MSKAINITKLPVNKIRKLIEAAKDMPRETPASGGSTTIHLFKIPAATVWALDKALKELGS